MSDNSLAFVFPGQGSQSVGMSASLAEKYTTAKEIYRGASDVLGYDLLKLVNNGPGEELNNTEKTQPALLTAGYATWQVWREKGGPLPAVMAGHSLGEYTALVCAGAMTFTDAVSLVADRGRFMQNAVPEGAGAMAAILGLDDDAVISVCEKVSTEGDIVSAANFNSPGQVVIAGHAGAVKRAVEEAGQAGARRSVLLPVSVPSHCRLMQPAAEQLAERLSNIAISNGEIPVVHNVDTSISQSADTIRQALVAQLSEPVRWVETINLMTRQGTNSIAECGPGKILCGLIKRIDRQLQTYSLHDAESVEQTLTALAQ